LKKNKNSVIAILGCASIYKKPLLERAAEGIVNPRRQVEKLFATKRVAFFHHKQYISIFPY
jgi:hypothetical protein